MTAIDYARGQDWYVEAVKPHGGFCFIHENSIHAVWGHLRSGEIALRDLRVWLACHELKARRCKLEVGRKPRFTIEEIHGLVGGVGGQHIRHSLRTLERHGLIRFREDGLVTTPHGVIEDRGRPIPVPRTVIRMLSKSSGRAYIATVLGHLLRCLYYKNGVCRSGGWCKASWVAEIFNVAVRAVKNARTKLVKLGVFILLRADQLRLNRLGRPLVISMKWMRESAHRKSQSTTISAPPRDHKKLSTRVDHQKPAQVTGSAGARTRAKEPNLNDVTVEDLKDPWRLAALFKQARLRGWVQKSEADILAVFSAAAHAVRVGTCNQPGLFRWLVERRDWTSLSLKDEDRGRRLIRLFQEHMLSNLSSREPLRRFVTDAELC